MFRQVLYILLYHNLCQISSLLVILFVLFFQLHLVGTGLFLPDILAAHPVFQHTDGGAADAAGDDGVAVLGAQKRGLVVLVDGAFLTDQQAGTHLHACLLYTSPSPRDA